MDPNFVTSLADVTGLCQWAKIVKNSFFGLVGVENDITATCKQAEEAFYLLNPLEKRLIFHMGGRRIVKKEYFFEEVVFK